MVSFVRSVPMCFRAHLSDLWAARRSAVKAVINGWHFVSLLSLPLPLPIYAVYVYSGTGLYVLMDR